MSSIPLPALHVEAPQQPDTLGNFQKLLAIKQQAAMAPLQQQQAQQNVQAGALEVQQKQQQLKDQQAITAAMQQWDGKDYNQLYPLVTKNGGSGTAVIGLKQKALEQQKSISDIAKNDAETGSKNVETMKQKNDMVSGALSTVMSQPDESIAQALTQTAQELAQKGLIDPAHAQGAMQLAQSGDPAKIRQQLDIIRKGSMAQSQITEEALKKAQTAKDVADTNRINQETSFGPTGPAAEAKYQFILGKIKRGDPVSKEELTYAQAHEASQSKTTTSSDSLGIKSVNTVKPSGLAAVGAKGSGGGGSAQPGAMNSVAGTLVDEIGQGRMPMQRLEMLITRRPELAAAVAQKYPDFDGAKVKGYADAMHSFVAGVDGKQVNAGAVAIQHLADLKRINDENPTESRIPGTAPYKAFHNLLDTVADELGTFYGEPKTNEVIESKKATLGGLTNRNAAILEQAKAMGIKMDEMEQKWQNAAPSKAYQAPMPGMSEKAKQARAALDPEYAQTYQQQSAASKGGGAQHTAGAKAGLQEGATGTGSDGQKYVVKGGVWVRQ